MRFSRISRKKCQDNFSANTNTIAGKIINVIPVKLQELFLIESYDLFDSMDFNGTFSRKC